MNAPQVAMPPREIADLPGPKGLPIFGNTFQMRRDALHQVPERWAQEYGDYFRFSIGSRKFLAIADPEAIAAVLRDRPDGFHRSKRLEEEANRSGFGGLFSSNGERWKRQRPMVMAGFDPAHIKAYYPTLLKVTERFRKRWARAAASGSRPGEAINLQADLMRYTVDVTCGLAFGVDMNTLESDGEVIQQHLDKMLPALFDRLMAPFPYWKYFLLPKDRAMEKHRIALKEAVEGFIAGARRRLEANPDLRAHPTNLIEAMVAARDTEGSNLDDADVSGNVLTMLLAGEDTTANTLAWMIYLLSRHPEALKKAKDEVKAVLGEAKLPTHEQLGKLAYVDACMNETMRVKPVAPIMIMQAGRESIVAGIRVPKGQLVFCLMRPPANSEKYFRESSVFRPERWLETGTPAASSAKRVAMPFGAGPRLCPGRYLAMHEMKMVMAMVLASFDIAEVATPDGAEAREELHLTMQPVGLKLRLRTPA